MRSRKAGWMVSVRLAVQMNITFERSNGTPEVVVAEGVVLLGVEHLEQRRARVAAEVGADLVHLVHHEDRVVGARLVDALDDAAGHRADVGAPVAADLGLVLDPAQGEAHELAAQGAGDGPPEARLAHAGRAHEAEERPLRLLLELAHRQVLDDALLDLLEAVVVLVEDPLRLLEVEVVLGGLAPGQRHHPVEPVAQGRGLRRVGVHALELLELALHLLQHRLRHLRLLGLLAELRDLLRQLVALAQLATGSP